MDQSFITRRLVVLARQLRDEARKTREVLHNNLTRFANSLDDLKDAVSTEGKANEESQKSDNPVTVSNPRTDVPIRVQTEPNRSKIKAVWGVIKGALEAGGIIAVIAYTYFAYHQWQEMITANDVSMSNFRRARIDANGQLKESMNQTKLIEETLEETRKNFVDDERAWIGVVLGGVKNPHPLWPYSWDFTYKFKNYGKSPAFKVWTEDNARAYGINFPDSPDYPKHISPLEVHSMAPVLPGQQNEMPGTSHIPPAIIEEMKAGKKWWYTYGEITYYDIFGTRHTTHFCYRWGINPPDNLPIICDSYNDAK